MQQTIFHRIYLHVECSRLKVKLVAIRTLFMGVMLHSRYFAPSSPKPTTFRRDCDDLNNDSLTRTAPMTHERTHIRVELISSTTEYYRSLAECDPDAHYITDSKYEGHTRSGALSFESLTSPPSTQESTFEHSFPRHADYRDNSGI